MIMCGNWPVGICSWSLQTNINEVAEAMRNLGIEHIHLAVGPALKQNRTDYINTVLKQTWTITATMLDFPQEDYSSLESIKATGGIAPDESWQRNRQLFLDALDVTSKLGVKYLSMHAGFIDLNQPEYARKFYDRITNLADEADKKKITLLLETGQETARQLRKFLQALNHPAVGVNFDPANVILYDKGNPIEDLQILQTWIKHIHIKDAIRTTRPGTWGTEVPWGTGQVGHQKFLKTLSQIGYKGALAVEREAGNDRFGDIKLAVESLRGIGT